MELFRDVSIDWLGKKWYFFGLSWILILIGIVGYFVRGGLAYGIDFSGGTIVVLKFNQRPDVDKLRRALRTEATGTPIIQTYDDPAKNSVQVRVPTVLGAGHSVDEGQKQLQAVLRQALDPEHVGSPQRDFNRIGLDPLTKHLLDADPDGLRKQGKTTQEIENPVRTAAR